MRFQTTVFEKETSCGERQPLTRPMAKGRLKIGREPFLHQLTKLNDKAE